MFSELQKGKHIQKIEYMSIKNEQKQEANTPNHSLEQQLL